MAETITLGGGGGSGFFAGAASALQNAQTNALAQQQQALAERRQATLEETQTQATASERISAGMKLIQETVKAIADAGKDPREALPVVQNIANSMKGIAAKAGYPAEYIDNAVQTMVLRPPLSEDGSHQVVKVAGSIGEPERVLRLEKKTGSITPINPATGRPFTESEVITPRQAQVVNQPTLGGPPVINAPVVPQPAPAAPASPAMVVNDRFPTSDVPAVPVAPQAPMTAPGPAVTPQAPVRNEQAIQTLSEKNRNMIKRIADYDFDIRTIPRDKRLQIINAVAEYSPDFNQADYSSIAATKKAFTSGVEARNLTSLGTIIGHIGDLASAGRALDNFKQNEFGAGTKAVNAMRKWMLENKQDPRVRDFETAAEAVATELDRAFRGSTTAVATIKGWRDNISSAMSPEEMATVNTRIGSLLGSRVKELVQQYERIPGPARPNGVTLKLDAVRSQIEKIAKGEAEGFVPSKTPATGGKVEDPLGIR